MDKNSTARRLLITADRVWDGLAPEPIERGFVLVEGGTIVAVGRQGDLVGVEADDRIALPGATLLPGLINGHVHLTFSASMTTVADYQQEARDGLCTLMVRAVHNLEAAARVGVTTVRDLGTVNEVAFAAREAVAAGRLIGPRVITSGRPITITGGHCHWFSHQCDTADEVRTAVRRQVSEGADLIKIFAGGGNMTPRTNPFEPQYSEAEVAACVAEARRLRVPVAAHAHAPEAIRRAAAAGVDTIEHCLFETPDGVAYDPATAELMARQGTAFCPTMGAGLLRLAGQDLSDRPVLQRIMARLPVMLEALRSLLAAGVPLLAGSDAGIPTRPFDDYPADVGALVGDRGLQLTPRQALMAATSEAATILGLPDTGVLAAGRRADLLAVTGDPLTDIGDLLRTRVVLVGGRPVALAPERAVEPAYA